MSRRPVHLKRLSTPLLLGLLAACGGGADEGPMPASASPQAGLMQPGIESTPGPFKPSAASLSAEGGHASGTPTPRHDVERATPVAEGSDVPAARLADNALSEDTAAASSRRPETSAAATSPSASSPSGASTAQASSQLDGLTAGTDPEPGTSLNASSCEHRYVATARPTVRVGTDPLELRQWHLNNTGSVTDNDGKSEKIQAGEDLRLLTSRQSYKGEGIRVAVLDDAIDLTHEDLHANVVPGASLNFSGGKDFVGNAWPLPCAATDLHGTQVAGIIAARDNNGVGISGVAPRVGLIGLNPLATNLLSDQLKALNHRLDQVHIYNNSWGSADDGHFHSIHANTRKSIETGLKNGRGGLGAIYVFSAGNGGCRVRKGNQEDVLAAYHERRCHSSDLSGWDANASQYGGLAICAFTANGKRALYSEAGSNLLVCAPSGDMFTTPPGLQTTSVNNGYAEFNGTSGAAPAASGAIALLLQSNPRLSWRDVRLILARSARKIDSSNPGWTSYRGLNFNHEYGFGAIDTDAAVKLASNWQSVGTSDSIKTCTIGSHSLNLKIGTDAAVSDRVDYNVAAQGGTKAVLEIPASCDIEHIEFAEVKLQVTGTDGQSEHPRSGNLHITLTSPSNQTSTLTVPHLCEVKGSLSTACTGLKDYTFGITRHLEEPASHNGSRQWTLKLLDRSGESETPAGMLKSWSLTLYGR